MYDIGFAHRWKHINLATKADLPYIEKTYRRSGHTQLKNRIDKNQMWVMKDDDGIIGYIGIHKDCSLGFEYVAPRVRRQGIATKLQNYVALQMMKNKMIPYVMISLENKTAMNFQENMGTAISEKLFYFNAKGPYEFE